MRRRLVGVVHAPGQGCAQEDEGQRDRAAHGALKSFSTLLRLGRVDPARLTIKRPPNQVQLAARLCAQSGIDRRAKPRLAIRDEDAFVKEILSIVSWVGAAFASSAIYARPPERSSRPFAFTSQRPLSSMVLQPWKSFFSARAHRKAFR